VVGQVKVVTVRDQWSHGRVGWEGLECVVPILGVLFRVSKVWVVVEVGLIAFIVLFLLHFIHLFHLQQLLFIAKKGECSSQNSDSPAPFLLRTLKNELPLESRL